MTATVFREGHDQLGAEVVLTGPDGVRREPVRMHDDPRPAPADERHRARRRRGGVVVRDPVLERHDRHLAPRRRHQDPGRRGRRADVHRGRAGPRAGDRRGRPDQGRAGRRPRRRQGLPRHQATGGGPPRGRRLRRAPRRAGGTPAPRPAQLRGPLPRLRRPREGAVLQLVRVLPALRGRVRRREDRHPRQRQPGERREAARGRRRDGLRRDLPAADPPDRRGQPQGRQQHAHPDAGRRRLPLGHRQPRRRPRRDPPRPRHARRLRRVRRRGRPARARGRAGLRPAGRAGPPVGDRAPRVVHHPGRRHHRLRREPAEEVPGHLPDQLRQRPRGDLRRVRAARPPLDVPRRADLPRRQPAHQAAAVLGVAARAGSGRPTPT